MTRGRGWPRISPLSWVVGLTIVTLVLGVSAWLIFTDAPAYRFLVRLHVDKEFMHATGVWRPGAYFAVCRNGEIPLASRRVSRAQNSTSGRP